jgi:hypothetical protein
MHRSFARALPLLLGLAAAGACGDREPSAPYPGPGRNDRPLAHTTISATGDIAARVVEFRALLGEPSNGGTAGEQAAGRREIAWDGAAADPFNNKNDFPASFFNSVVKSGAVFATPGTGFRNDSLRFAEVNATYQTQFGAFSPTKVFAPIGSNVMDVLFQVAGEVAPAHVTGFGAVFSDVDVAGRTTIEFFDASGASIATIAAPARSDAAGLSFVGAMFADAVVARARITLGTGALGPDVFDLSTGGTGYLVADYDGDDHETDDTIDLVVVDNFLFGEPRRIRD